jgi:hypothetical protein
MTPPHPTQTIRLYALAAWALLTGILGLILLGNLDYSTQHLATALLCLIVVSFVLFVIACAAGIFGWLIREHEIWRKAGGPEHGAVLALERAKAEAATAAWAAHVAREAAHEDDDD